MYTKCKIKVTTDEEGFVSHAVLKVPKEHIKIEIKNRDGIVEYLLVWNCLSVFVIVPIENVSEEGLTAETFEEVFKKPYKAVYKVLDDVEDVIWLLMHSAKELEETEGLSNAKVVTRISTYDNGMVRRATIGPVNYPIFIDLTEHADINVAQVDVHWEGVVLSVHAPYSPYFESLFQESTIRELFTNFYTTAMTVLENLKRVIRDYKNKAKEKIDSVVCTTG